MLYLLQELLPFLPQLIVAGMAAGILAGLFGIGGGLVVVPALYTLLEIKGVAATSAMAMALSTSLASILPTSLSSLRAHNRLANVRWDILKLWWPGLMLGVIVGSQIIAQVRSRFFILYFGVFLLFVALHNLLFAQRAPVEKPLPAKIWQHLLALVLGFLSVIAGVGGGSLGVPLLKHLGVDVHKAVGTCAAFGFCVALPSVISLALLTPTPAAAPYGVLGLIYLPALIFMAPLTVVCAPWGAKLGKKIPAKWLMRLFGAFLVLVAIKMILNAYHAAP